VHSPYMFERVMEEPSPTETYRTIEVSLPAELLARLDEMVLRARAFGQPWGRSELLARALAERLPPHATGESAD